MLTHLPADDATVRFRKHQDGSMTILTKDGMRVIDHIRASEFRGGTDRPNCKPKAELKGLALGFILGLAAWTVIGLVIWIALR